MHPPRAQQTARLPKPHQGTGAVPGPPLYPLSSPPRTSRVEAMPTGPTQLTPKPCSPHLPHKAAALPLYSSLHSRGPASPLSSPQPCRTPLAPQVIPSDRPLPSTARTTPPGTLPPLEERLAPAPGPAAGLAAGCSPAWTPCWILPLPPRRQPAPSQTQRRAPVSLPALGGHVAAEPRMRWGEAVRADAKAEWRGGRTAFVLGFVALTAWEG